MNKLQNIQTFVFDMDGTLLSRISYERLLNQVAEATRHPFEELFARYQSTWQGFEEAQRYHERLAQTDQLPLLKTIYDQFYRIVYDVQMIDGVTEILTQLRSQGKKLICWTSGDEASQKSLFKSSGLEPYFDTIIVAALKNKEYADRLLLPVIKTDPFVIIGDSYERDILPVIEDAEIGFWITDSEANQYLQPPKHIDPKVISIARVSELKNFL